MRLVLLVLLLSLPALPAAADHRGFGRGPGAAPFHGFGHRHAFRFRGRPFGFRGGPFAFRGGPFGFGGGPFGFGGAPFWGYFPDWDWGWGGDWAWNGGNAPAMPAPALPAPAYLPPPHFAAAERPSIETTAQGVTIIRGPGSHHFSP